MKHPRPVWIAVLVMPALLAQDESPVVLPQGQPVERPLASGEHHVYRTEGTGAGPWRLVVEQRGIDVAVVLTSADGRQIAVDNPLDRHGSERLLFEPEARGPFHVEVRAHEAGAPPGHYTIRLEALTAEKTSPEATRLIEAERALTRAGELYFEGSTEGRRKAVVEHEQALIHWRALGNRRQEARALYSISVLSRLADDTGQALDRAREVLPIWQVLGEPLWEAATLNELGLVSRLAGEPAEARRHFDRALAVYRRIGEPYGEATALANVCLMDLVQGEIRAGAACYEHAIPRLREIRAPNLRTAAHNSVGRAYDILGEPEKALGHYREALALIRSGSDRKAEGQTENGLAVLYRSLGEMQEALVHYGRALEIFRQLEDRRWQARVLGNVGRLYLELEDVERSTASFREALALWRELADPRGQATVLGQLGAAHSRQERHREAIDLYRQALALRRSVDDRRGEGVTLSLLGHTQLEAAQYDAALDTFRQALPTLREVGDRRYEALALRHQGGLYTLLGKPEEALPVLSSALELNRAAHNQAGEAHTLEALARAKRAAGNLEEALKDALSALDRFESLRARISLPELRATSTRRQHQAYQLTVDLLMQAHRAAPDAGHDRRALEVAERSRARSLLELLAEARIDLDAGVDSGLIERRKSLEGRLNAKVERLQSRRLEGRERRDLVAEHSQILRDLDLVEAEIRSRSPSYAEQTWPRPAGVDGIRGLLDDDTTLLTYALGEPRSFLWAVTRDSVRSFELPGRNEIEDAARRWHAELARLDTSTARADAETARTLGAILLGPLAELPATSRLATSRLAIVADGALHYLPFAALPLPALEGVREAPLVIDRHEVVQLPSASVLVAARRMLAGRPPPAEWIAVVADPVFDANDSRIAGTARTAPGTRRVGTPPVFERLPATLREAEAISALVPPGRAFTALGFEADRQRVLGNRLAAYRVVHFATHGVIDARQPALSGLVLSLVDENGRPRDGFLGLRDLYDMELNADLVVLSGCRTALGREIRGEGLVGLTRAFFYAGAPRVIASLWRVEDRATAALMHHFYRFLWQEGLPPAAALRAAQLELRQDRRWRHPSSWAGFVLVGEWR